MAFITDKEELKPGLIIFRRGDVTHRNFYCRVKLPKDDRYKTIALGTPDPGGRARPRLRSRRRCALSPQARRAGIQPALPASGGGIYPGAAAPRRHRQDFRRARQKSQECAAGRARPLCRQHANSFGRARPLGWISDMAAREWQGAAPRPYQRCHHRLRDGRVQCGDELRHSEALCPGEPALRGQAETQNDAPR